MLSFETHRYKDFAAPSRWRRRLVSRVIPGPTRATRCAMSTPLLDARRKSIAWTIRPLSIQRMEPKG